MKKSILLLIVSACVTLCSCMNSESRLESQCGGLFAGNWQGSGVDSEGNEFHFAAKVIALGDCKYRMLILDRIDIQKEPMHVMDGVLKDCQFNYTADEGIYTGSGKLNGNQFEGYYKGPVDGTFTMWRIKKES